ncbi:MAG: hypothetical protein CMJ84_16615 [Planctomycetes bacterium]|jgi:hypothetical protein|nr:hypothetical protein [Planctomycetota bacterium]
MSRTEGQVLADVKRLATEYYELTGKPLGVTGEVAEFEAARLLGFELAPPRTPGYDAVGPDGRKIQIKGRRVSKKEKLRQRVGSIDLKKPFDSVVLVLLNMQFDVLEIWEAPRGAIEKRIKAPGSKARNERGQLAVSQFVSVATRVWARDRLGPRQS